MKQSNVISGVSAVLCVIALYPTYIHLLKWQKPTRIPLTKFSDLKDSNKDNRLIVQSHLSEKEATDTLNGLLKRTEKLREIMKTEFKKNKFTIVMPSYKRTETLHEVFDHYCSMDDIIDKLLIVWNNPPNMPVPNNLRNYKCNFPIIFLEQQKNTLNNRFVPFPEIETECVMSLDDDRVISKDTLTHGFEMWKAFPHLLVGYIARIHGYNHVTHSYFYRVQGVTTPQPYSITLTISAFLHLRYLEEFTNNLPQEAKEFVDKNINCEDLFLVAMISKYLEKNDEAQCACMWIDEVAANLKNARIGLSSDRSHYTERDECLNLMVKLFNGFPLDRNKDLAINDYKSIELFDHFPCT